MHSVLLASLLYSFMGSPRWNHCDMRNFRLEYGLHSWSSRSIGHESQLLINEIQCKCWWHFQGSYLPNAWWLCDYSKFHVQFNGFPSYTVISSRYSNSSLSPMDIHHLMRWKCREWGDAAYRQVCPTMHLLVCCAHHREHPTRELCPGVPVWLMMEQTAGEEHMMQQAPGKST